MIKVVPVAVAALALLSACASHAQAHNPIPASTGGFSPFLGAGITYGGDQVGDDIKYENGDSASIHAGGLADVRAGIEYQTAGSPWSFQMSVGYHFDQSNAENGRVTFSRVPVEALAHWQIPASSWRIGGGLRKALNARADTSGLGDQFAADQSYKSSVGLVVEAETLLTRSFGLKLRVVSEKYKPEIDGDKELDGSHIGLIGVYYFNK